MTDENDRETGARKLMPKTRPDVTDEFSQKAAENKRPPTGVGNTEQVDDVDEKTRHSDGRQPPRRQPEPAPAKPSEKDRPL